MYSCISAVYMEVINHYFLSGNSNVCSCLLDASKVDHVHFRKLFEILLKKISLCTLLDCYMIHAHARFHVDYGRHTCLSILL